MRIIGDDLARFWSKVDKRGENECWHWTAKPKTHQGYPVIRIGDRQWVAHRWLWEQNHGPIPLGYQIDHLCRSIDCLNPTHHEAVTQAENRRRQAAAMRERVCDVPDCDRPHRARGLCGRHYTEDYRRRVPRRS